jgi:hypothetical protein
MNRWRTAALNGISLAAIAVGVSILANGLWHGWDTVIRRGSWVVPAIPFPITALIVTVLFGAGLWRDGRRAKTSGPKP